MKNIFVSLLIALPLVGVSQEVPFTINGKVENTNGNEKAHLYYFVGGATKYQTVDVKNGHFQIEASIPHPVEAWLYLAHNGENIPPRTPNTDRLVMFIEPGVTNISVKDSISQADLSDSPLYMEFMQYKEIFVDVDAKAQEIQSEKNAFNRQMYSRTEKVKEEKSALQETYIKNHPSSILSLIALKELAGDVIQKPEYVSSIFNTLSPALRDSDLGKEIATKLHAANSTTVGSIALDFTQSDVDGKLVSLSDFRGKYVLLDFWASWCGPCRAENPNVVAAYAKYKDSNFEVLGVSLDKEADKEAWLKAIEADGLTWTNVSDLKGWQNEAAVLYNIRAVPTTYLIDPEGKIIESNLRGQKLNDKLAELFGK